MLFTNDVKKSLIFPYGFVQKHHAHVDLVIGNVAIVVGLVCFAIWVIGELAV